MKEIRTQSPRSEARCRPIFAAGLAIGSCGESGRAGYGISLLARFIVDKINRFLGGSAVLCLPCVLREHGRPGTWHQRIYIRPSLRLRVLVQLRTASGSYCKQFRKPVASAPLYLLRRYSTQRDINGL